MSLCSSLKAIYLFQDVGGANRERWLLLALYREVAMSFANAPVNPQVRLIRNVSNLLKL